jgi:preprotein translocase subunit Sss1
MSEVTDKLLELRKKSALETTSQETMVEPVAETSVTQEPVVENKVVEEKIVQAKEQPVVEQTPAPETSWDDTPEVEVKPTTQNKEIDYSELGSALGLGEIKSREEFVAKTSELKSKLKEYEEKPLAGIPEEFQEVIKVAKTSDWKEYLASQLIDYTKLDPIEEFENDYISRAQNNPRFFTDGKYDHTKVEEALDAMPEATRELHGQQMLQAKAYQQAQRKAALEAQAQAKIEAADKSLLAATKNLQEILPLDQYAIKFEPKHSNEIYNGIVNSSLTKKHLGARYEDLVRMGADMKSVVRTITMAEKGEKMIAFKSASSKTAVKKEILQSTQNVQLNSTGTNLNPEDPEKKAPSVVDNLKQHFANQRKGL